MDENEERTGAEDLSVRAREMLSELHRIMDNLVPRVGQHYVLWHPDDLTEMTEEEMDQPWDYSSSTTGLHARTVSIGMETRKDGGDGGDSDGAGDSDGGNGDFRLCLCPCELTGLVECSRCGALMAMMANPRQGLCLHARMMLEDAGNRLINPALN